MDALVGVEVDDGGGLAGAVDDVLGYVEGAGMAFGAETAAFAVGIVGMGAGGAVGGVLGELAHDVQFVVFGEARVGGRYGRESRLTGAGGRHGGGFAVGFFEN